VRSGPERPFLAEVSADPGRLRIAFTSVAPNGAPVEADSLRALAEAAKLCADLGHRVEEVEPEIDGAAVIPAFLTLASANTVVNLASHPTKGRPPRPGEGRERHIRNWAAGREGHRRRLHSRDADGAPPWPANGGVSRDL